MLGAILNGDATRGAYVSLFCDEDALLPGE